MTVTTAEAHGIEAMAAAHGAAAVHPGTAAGVVARTGVAAVCHGTVAGAEIAIMAVLHIMAVAPLTTAVALLITADILTTVEIHLHPLLHLKLHNTRQ